MCVFALDDIGYWRYPIGFAVGWAVGEFVVAWRQRYLAERDAVFRQYVQLHPDDFKPISKLKFVFFLDVAFQLVFSIS